MHREDNSNYVLFIQPKGNREQPIDDTLTKFATRVFSKAKSGTSQYSDLEDQGKHFSTGSGFKGAHRCICGANSGSKDYQLQNGMITNGLFVHYIREHRSQIPKTEWKKIKLLIQYYKKEK